MKWPGWRLCFSCLASTVIIEVIVIIFTVLYLYSSRLYEEGMMANSRLTSAVLAPGGVRINAGLLMSTQGVNPRLPPASEVAMTTTSVPWDIPKSQEQFAQEYEAFCRALQFKPNREKRPLCDCVPSTLVGHQNISFQSPPFGELELAHPELEPGGQWQPDVCIARHHVAIIIPFRDREDHLRIFLNHMHPFLQRQQIHYRLFIVEQNWPSIFNKATMMNIGFLEASKMFNFDCYIFHDVDMLPENDFNFYVCSSQPRHVGSHCDKWNYTVPYKDIFGGAIALNKEQFVKVNGFSNEFYGWGGEDDDMYKRVSSRKFTIVRYPGSVARYTMIKHKADKGNPYNVNSGVAWQWRPRQYLHNGLNTLRYTILEIENRPLYTWVHAKIPPAPPRGRRQVYWRNSAVSWTCHKLGLGLLFLLCTMNVIVIV